MKRRFAYRSAILLLGVATAGCRMEVTGLDLGDAFGGGTDMNKICSTGAASPSNFMVMSPFASQYVLLGDTASFFAHMLCTPMDSVRWHADRAIISVAAGPDQEVGKYSDAWWHIAVRGDSVGTTTLTASAAASASASVGVIAAADLRRLTVERRCNYVSAPGHCPINGEFNDTLKVGDTASLRSHLTDVSGHDVSSTVKWSTSNAAIGSVEMVKQAPGVFPIVVALGVGDATIAAAAAGFNASFVLHVVK